MPRINSDTTLLNWIEKNRATIGWTCGDPPSLPFCNAGHLSPPTAKTLRAAIRKEMVILRKETNRYAKIKK